MEGLDLEGKRVENPSDPCQKLFSAVTVVQRGSVVTNKPLPLLQMCFLKITY